MKRTTDNFESGVRDVFARLMSLSESEFRTKLESHKGGNFSRILLETRTLEIRELEDWGSWDDAEITLPISFKVPIPPEGDMAEWIGSGEWVHLETRVSPLDFGPSTVACDFTPDLGNNEGAVADDYPYSVAA